MKQTLQVSALMAATLSLTACGTFQMAGSTRSQARVTLRVADAALESGAPSVALRVAEVVLERQPNNVPAMVAKGDALYAMGEIDQARSAYRAAVAADPDNMGGRLGLGRTLARTEPHDAEMQFLAVLAKQPDNVIALNNLGITRDLQNHHEQAQQAYRQALALKPDMADVKTNLGLSLALSGQAMQAVQLLRPVAVATEAGAMQRADLAVAMAQVHDPVSRDTVAQQTAQVAAAHSELPIAINTAPVAPVQNEPLLPPARQPTTAVAENVEPARSVVRVIKPVTVAKSVAPVVSTAMPPPQVAQLVKSTATAALPSQPIEQIVKPVVATVGPVAPVEDEALPPQPVVHVVKPVEAVKSTPAPVSVVRVASAPATEEPVSREASTVDANIYVQVAALDSEQRAQVAWQQLRARWPDLLGDHAPAVQQAEVHDRTFWRLRTSGFTSVGDAHDFCQKLRAAGSECWTVGLVVRN